MLSWRVCHYEHGHEHECTYENIRKRRRRRRTRLYGPVLLGSLALLLLCFIPVWFVILAASAVVVALAAIWILN